MTQNASHNLSKSREEEGKENDQDAAQTSYAQEDTSVESPAGYRETEEGEQDLRQKIQHLEAENLSLKDKALRALAEVENIRRRGEKERADANKYAISKFAKDLLSVADNLQRALDALPPQEEGQDAIQSGLLQGIKATQSELFKTFSQNGIEKLTPLGEKFDPNFHQAMVEIADEQHPAGTVVQVMQDGYMLQDRLLRAALVGVAKPAQKPTLDTQI